MSGRLILLSATETPDDGRLTAGEALLSAIGDLACGEIGRGETAQALDAHVERQRSRRKVKRPQLPEAVADLRAGLDESPTVGGGKPVSEMEWQPFSGLETPGPDEFDPEDGGPEDD